MRPVSGGNFGSASAAVAMRSQQPRPAATPAATRARDCARVALSPRGRGRGVGRPRGMRCLARQSMGVTLWPASVERVVPLLHPTPSPSPRRVEGAPSARWGGGLRRRASHAATSSCRSRRAGSAVSGAGMSKVAIGCADEYSTERQMPAREGGELGVVDAHRLDVVAPRDGDAVLGALELRLQGEEVLPRLDVGIALGHDQQLAQRAAKLVLRVLEALHGLGIGEHVGAGSAPAPGVALARASITLVSTFCSCVGEAFDGLDQVGDEVGAPLVLAQSTSDHLALAVCS